MHYRWTKISLYRSYTKILPEPLRFCSFELHDGTVRNFLLNKTCKQKIWVKFILNSTSGLGCFALPFWRVNGFLKRKIYPSKSANSLKLEGKSPFWRMNRREMKVNLFSQKLIHLSKNLYGSVIKMNSHRFDHKYR